MSFSPPARIAVIGPGLLGGSLLLMLKARHATAELRAWSRRNDAVEQILRDKLADNATTDLAVAVKDADLVILCTPISSMPEVARQIAQSQPAPGCVVTDVGSVKMPIVTALEGIFTKSNATFVGGHPMAGSEKSGIEAARADLFDGAAAIITPTLFSSDQALEVLRWLWRLAGCKVLEMPPEEHDRKVARISHLPHLMAWSLTLAALHDDASTGACAGGSFRDSTRTAASDPALWSGIISQNKAEVMSALGDAREIIDRFLSVIQNKDENALRRMIEEARNLHQRAAGG